MRSLLTPPFLFPWPLNLLLPPVGGGLSLYYAEQLSASLCAALCLPLSIKDALKFLLKQRAAGLGFTSSEQQKKKKKKRNVVALKCEAFRLFPHQGVSVSERKLYMLRVNFKMSGVVPPTPALTSALIPAPGLRPVLDFGCFYAALLRSRSHTL